MVRLAAMLSILTFLSATIGTVLAQAPSAAQQQAIRSNCVSDYRKHCSDVPTGGMDALICLEKNVSDLSPACQTAVESVEPHSNTSSGSTAAASPAASTPVSGESHSSGQDSGAAATGKESVKSAPTTSKPAAAVGAHAPALSFRQELKLAAGDCATDFRLLCPNLPVGHGNVLFCLKVHSAKLGPQCQGALTRAGVLP